MAAQSGAGPLAAADVAQMRAWLKVYPLIVANVKVCDGFGEDSVQKLPHKSAPLTTEAGSQAAGAGYVDAWAWCGSCTAAPKPFERPRAVKVDEMEADKGEIQTQIATVCGCAESGRGCCRLHFCVRISDDWGKEWRAKW